MQTGFFCFSFCYIVLCRILSKGIVFTCMYLFKIGIAEFIPCFIQWQSNTLEGLVSNQTSGNGKFTEVSYFV